MAFGQYLGYIGGVVGAVVGGVVGFYSGGPGGAFTGAVYGFSIGSMIGGISGQVFWPEKADLNLAPPPQPHETRLQFSSWGMPIPVQYGSGRMAGNIIYMSDIVETIYRSRHRQDGVRYYEMTKTYTATFAIAFCAGPIKGVARIWMNNKIFVDWRDPDGPYYPAGGGTYASGNLDTSIDRRAAFFRLHLGGETQAADTSIVAILGAAEVPAYRGLFYIVFIDFPIGEFSGVPNIEVEVDEDIVYVEPVYRITEDSHADYGWNSVGTAFRYDNIGCGFDYGTYTLQAWIRFQNVTIPAGATLSEVLLTLNIAAEGTGTNGVTLFEVRIDETDNAIAPANMTEYNAKSWSTAYVQGQHVYTGGAVPTTVLNLAPLMQSVVDRPGWVSGNAIQFKFTPAAANGANDKVLWRDAYSGASRPYLTVKYW